MFIMIYLCFFIVQAFMYGKCTLEYKWHDCMLLFIRKCTGNYWKRKDHALGSTENFIRINFCHFQLHFGIFLLIFGVEQRKNRKNFD